MKRFLFLLMALSNLAFSQPRNDFWRLTIINKATSKGIARATIVINNKLYFITDMSGKANIERSVVQPKDSVRFSCIGFQSKWLKLSVGERLPDTIWLNESTTVLDEVKINPLTSSLVALAAPKTLYLTHFQSNPNLEFAQYVPNEKNIDGTISSVEFEMNNDLHGIDMPFNIEILSRSKDSIFPDTALITDSIVVRNLKKKQRLSVDISRYHIRVPDNGFFVVFQTLPQSAYAKDSIFYNGSYRRRVPGINIYLMQKNLFEGECCDVNPPKLTGFYCLLSCNRDEQTAYEKSDQWIVYVQGINLAISATVIQ